MKLREKTAAGIVWTVIRNWGQQAINFLIFLVLARLLEPSAFGMLAMANVFVVFMRIFLDQGLSNAVIQHPDLQPTHLDSAFWMNILMGSVLTTSGILLSGTIAGIYNEPRLSKVVAWLSFSFLIGAFSSTQQAILRRNMDFKSLTMRTLIASVVGGIIGISAAYLGKGVWSLVIQNLTGAVVTVVVLWRISGWRPRFRFSWLHFKELFSFSVNMMGLQITAFFRTRIDDFIVGYILGSTALGYYSIAYKLMRLLNQFLVGVSSSVVFPLFSRLQKQPERLRQVLYQSSRLTSLGTFPIVFGIILITPELVPVLYGDKWIPSILAMQILSLGSLQSSISMYHKQLIRGIGKPGWSLLPEIVLMVINVGGFIIVAPYGIEAVAIVSVVFQYASIPVFLWLSYRVVPYSFEAYFSQFRAPVVASFVMIIFVLGLKYSIGKNMEQFEAILLFVLSGMLIYVITVWFVQPSLWRQLFDFVSSGFAFQRQTKKENKR